MAQYPKVIFASREDLAGKRHRLVRGFVDMCLYINRKSVIDESNWRVSLLSQCLPVS